MRWRNIAVEDADRFSMRFFMSCVWSFCIAFIDSLPHSIENLKLISACSLLNVLSEQLGLVHFM